MLEPCRRKTYDVRYTSDALRASSDCAPHDRRLVVAARPKGGSTLSLDEIFSAALSIVDAEGLSALSMRRLASVLGVQAMSLYHHLANKDALLDGLVATVLSRMSLPDPAPVEPLALVEEMFCALRRAIADHPHTLPLLIARPLNTDVSASYVEAPIRVLAEADFPPERVGEVYRALIAFTFGQALVTATPPGPPGSEPPLAASDSTTRYPATTSLPASPRDFDEPAFRRGLRMLLDGYAEMRG
jgi:AcrR family transcriptional regulator